MPSWFPSFLATIMGLGVNVAVLIFTLGKRSERAISLEKLVAELRTSFTEAVDRLGVKIEHFESIARETGMKQAELALQIKLIEKNTDTLGTMREHNAASMATAAAERQALKDHVDSLERRVTNVLAQLRNLAVGVAGRAIIMEPTDD